MREETARLNGLFTEDGHQQVQKEKSHYAADQVFPLVSSFIDGSIGFEASSDLTRMNV